MISNYVQKGSVLFFDASNKEEAIEQIIDHAESKGILICPKPFRAAILGREDIMSTGLGMGVAVPHAKIPELDEFFVVCGVLKNPVDWDSIDGKPVDLVFLIGGPEDKQRDYLMLLSKIMLVIKNPKTRKALRKATTAEEFSAQFQGL